MIERAIAVFIYMVTQVMSRLALCLLRTVRWAQGLESYASPEWRAWLSKK